jgi:hypothetical protein
MTVLVISYTRGYGKTRAVDGYGLSLGHSRALMVVPLRAMVVVAQW